MARNLYGKANVTAEEADDLFTAVKVDAGIVFDLRLADILGRQIDGVTRADIILTIVDHRGHNLFHVAARHGRSSMIDRMLTHVRFDNWDLAANGNLFSKRSKFDGFTPLHVAARHGHVRCVEVMLLENANPALINMLDETARDVAARFGHAVVVSRLDSAMAAGAHRDNGMVEMCIPGMVQRESYWPPHYMLQSTGQKRD